MIDTIGDHTFTYSRFTQRYIIYVLVSLRLSLEIIAMHLAYSITLFFSAALMMRKFLTIFLFFSSSLINVGISYESMVSMLMWSNLWFIDTSSFEMSSIILIWTIYVYFIIYIFKYQSCTNVSNYSVVVQNFIRLPCLMSDWPAWAKLTVFPLFWTS